MRKQYFMFFVLSLCVAAALIYSGYALNREIDRGDSFPLSTPIKTSSPSPIVYPNPNVRPVPAITAPLPTCRTLGGKMIKLSTGLGQIGCDIEVTGVFDLQRSYCQGQKTGKTKSLIPDAYNQKDHYYATLTGLDTSEIVDVYIYSTGGQRILCTPRLNISSLY